LRTISTHILVAWLALPVGASADMVTLFPSKDNTLFEDATGSISNGAGDYLFVGRSFQPDNRRALLSFDVTAIPSGALVESASLTLHMSRTQTLTSAVSISAHRLHRAWGEGSSNAPSREEGAGAPAQTGDATWLHNFFNTSTWTTPGGDFDALASAMTSVGGLGFYAWSSPLLAQDVQDWIVRPDMNFGWLLLGDESEVPTAKRFDSRENPNLSFRPTLAISYTTVPEPATGAALLALLATARLRQRRADAFASLPRSGREESFLELRGDDPRATLGVFAR